MMKCLMIFACYLFILFAEAQNIEKNGNSLENITKRSVHYGSAEKPQNSEPINTGDNLNGVQLDITPGSGVDVTLRKFSDNKISSIMPDRNKGPFLQGTSLERSAGRINHSTPQIYLHPTTIISPTSQPYSIQVSSQVSTQGRNSLNFPQLYPTEEPQTTQAEVQYAVPVTRTIAIPIVRRVYIPVPIHQDESIAYQNFHEFNGGNTLNANFDTKVDFLDSGFGLNSGTDLRSGFGEIIGTDTTDGLLRSYVPSVQGGIYGHSPYTTEWQKTW